MPRSPISLFLLLALTLAACTGGGAGGDEAAAPDLRVVFVTHGQASDPFWSVVQNGARQAGRDLRVRVEYQAPTPPPPGRRCAPKNATFWRLRSRTC